MPRPTFVHQEPYGGSRCLIAVLENGQMQDGSVELPKVLHGYLGGKTRIAANGYLS